MTKTAGSIACAQIENGTVLYAAHLPENTLLQKLAHLRIRQTPLMIEYPPAFIIKRKILRMVLLEIFIKLFYPADGRCL